MIRSFAICAAVVLTVGTTAAFAQTAATLRIDERQARQEQRIDQGISSGALTRPEARRLDRQQNRIDRAENAAKADGNVTPGERRVLTKAQNRASRHVYRQKHDAQARP